MPPFLFLNNTMVFLIPSCPISWSQDRDPWSTHVWHSIKMGPQGEARSEANVLHMTGHLIKKHDQKTLKKLLLFEKFPGRSSGKGEVRTGWRKVDREPQKACRNPYSLDQSCSKQRNALRTMCAQMCTGKLYVYRIYPMIPPPLNHPPPPPHNQRTNYSLTIHPVHPPTTAIRSLTPNHPLHHPPPPPLNRPHITH